MIAWYQTKQHTKKKKLKIFFQHEGFSFGMRLTGLESEKRMATMVWREARSSISSRAENLRGGGIPRRGIGQEKRLKKNEEIRAASLFSYSSICESTYEDTSSMNHYQPMFIEPWLNLPPFPDPLPPTMVTLYHHPLPCPYKRSLQKKRKKN